MALAMLLKEVLPRNGYSVVVASRIERGLALAQSGEIDAAILDVNIAGERVYPVAAELVRRGIPFFFASGYGDATIDKAYSQYKILQKPYLMKQILATLESLLPAARE